MIVFRATSNVQGKNGISTVNISRSRTSPSGGIPMGFLGR